MIYPYNIIILCTVLYNTVITLREKIQKLQNRAARIVSGDTYEVRSHEILNKLEWKILEERREQQMTNYVTKAIR